MGDASPADVASPAYKVLQAPLGLGRHLRIVGIGAGASGLNMIRTLRKHLDNFEHVVYEKNPEVGGTWYENRYPGCMCDIPAHNYQFSWKPNPGWSSFFAPAKEIEQYMCQLCEDEGLRSSIKLSHSVTHAEWNEDKGTWQLKIKNLETQEIFDDYCHFLLDASGVLNNWKWPDIPGLHDFSGELVHSANWPEEFSYAGKKVAVIGNGSSGIQIVPALQPDVKQLVHFIRSPTWVVPTQLEAIMMGNNRSILTDVEMVGGQFTPQQIEKFKADPEYYLCFVKAVEEEVNSKFAILVNDSPGAKYAFATATAYMKHVLGDVERLTKALVPDFPVGCRRITPGVGYLPSLSKDNVTVVTDSIAKVVPKGIEMGDGEVIEVDAIVCATGFNVSFCPRFPIIGRQGNLQDLWTKNLPKAYMSTTVPDMPNYFMFLGPNAPVGHGSILTITEHIAKYIVRMIKKCQLENIKAVAPRGDAVAEFNAHIEAFMPTTAWSGPCRSWFKNGAAAGPVTAVHPGSRIHWFHMLESPRFEDYAYVPLGPHPNRFAYLGNGFSTRELPGADQTWYLDRPDDLY